ncbi:pyridoxamine 5'-phosphate oxidase family protein, partial [Salmonella enterica subsp. enterica serovar Enteritidis]|nr:pyridoxamine 5'-phosphate oxidase family protein [Salmonella enterica subsp. enterica serovar Enteritidis]
ALILRLYGTGRFVIAGEPGFDDLAQHFPRLPGARQIFDITVDSLQTSCGWGVPHLTLDRPRDTLVKYHAQQEPAARLAKIADRTTSIDGLPVRVQAVLPSFDAPSA